jgi:hypothetical protein
MTLVFFFFFSAEYTTELSVSNFVLTLLKSRHVVRWSTKGKTAETRETHLLDA